jgi:hypothetical protein
VEKYDSEYRRKQALEEASSEDSHEFSERHKYDMTCLVEDEVRPVDEAVHDLFIYPECEELERVEKKRDEKKDHTPRNGSWILFS